MKGRTIVAAVVIIAAQAFAADFPLDRADWLDVAQSRKNQNRLEAAVYAYEQALRLHDPTVTDAVLHFNIATLATRLGEQTKAIEHANAALRSKPDYGDAYATRGTAYLRLGEHQKAFDDYSKAIQSHCSRPWIVLNNRGLASEGLGRIEEALEDYALSIKANPDYMNVYWSRANAMVSQGQPQPAISDYDTAIRLDSGNAQLYLARGKAKGMVGDKEAAYADFDRAKRLDQKLAPQIANAIRKVKAEKR